MSPCLVVFLLSWLVFWWAVGWHSSDIRAELERRAMAAAYRAACDELDARARLQPGS